MSMPQEYDAIVIGTGAGGGTLALHLAQAGKKILILERGSFMPQEKLNWDTSAVFLHDLDNLYVVDASCFVSASAVNPSLTIIANAIRVADHLLAERLK
jgi:choline dehydrogenase-like flavoprotein